MSENKIEIELPEKEIKQLRDFCKITNLDLKGFLEKSILNELTTLKDEIDKNELTIIEDYFSEDIFNRLKSIFSGD